MNYLCLIYRDQTEYGAFPQYRDDGRDGKPRDPDCAVNVRHSVQAATTIRVRGDQIGITDGPVAATNVPLAEFCLINARDLNDAIRIASKMPLARAGSIEIRGIAE